MKKPVLTSLWLLMSLAVYSQPDHTCRNNLDTASVILIAKKHHAYWTKHWAFIPQLSFNEQHCEWVVHSMKTEHITKGKCKYTNGCTKITSVTLTINAATKKVKSKKKKYKLYPNYE